jgi:hypothetical protein
MLMVSSIEGANHYGPFESSESTRSILLPREKFESVTQMLTSSRE